LRASSAIRAAAVGVLAAGIAAPLVRRSPGRDVATCVLQMWAYVATYEMPNDDPERLLARVRIDYPVKADTVLGLGTPPTLRLQRHSDPRSFSLLEKVLVWAHWVWFLVPHGTVAYILLRHRDRFPSAAARLYATFDLGVTFYWTIPTAPPWYAAQQGRLGAGSEREDLVQDGWQPLYSFLAGNPLAAMPSLHFATAVMAARLLAETGPGAGAIGWTYAMTLGLALVYLGEHYLADLLAGFALTEVVRRGAPRAAPLARLVSRSVQALEARAHPA